MTDKQPPSFSASQNSPEPGMAVIASFFTLLLAPFAGMKKPSSGQVSFQPSGSAHSQLPAIPSVDQTACASFKSIKDGIDERVRQGGITQKSAQFIYPTKEALQQYHCTTPGNMPPKKSGPVEIK